MPSFHKSKQNRLKDMKKRFQFNPQHQHQTTRSSAVVIKQKISDIIIRDQNGEFSSVKQKNDFNDSSWLAKLVNGIEEYDNLSIRPSSQIQNLQTIATQNIQLKNQNEGEAFTITRKNSDSGHKTTGRKSVSNVCSQRNKPRVRESSKMSCHTIQTQSEYKKQQKNQKIGIKNRLQKRLAEQIHIKQDLKKGNRNASSEKIQGRIDLRVKQQANQNHKNSLINYSSIEEDDRNFDTQKEESPERIVIDLDQISLKTEMSKQATPIQSKAIKKQQVKQTQTKEKESSSKKINRRRTSSKVSDGSKQIGYVSSKADIKLHSTPVAEEKRKSFQKARPKDDSICQIENQKKEKKEKRENEKIEVKQTKLTIQPLVKTDLKEAEHCQENQVFSSQNQFLDTFKQYSLKYSNSKVGAIKKNYGRQKSTEFVSRLQIKDIAGSFSEQARIPTFSERPLDELTTFIKVENIRQCPTKKGTTFSPIKGSQFIKKQNLEQKSISTIKKGESIYTKFNEQERDSQRQVVCQQFTKESPKFNYKCTEVLKNCQNSQNKNSKLLAYQELFRKLDGKKEKKINKYNCKQSTLNEEEKYQIGSILSKIKYLGKQFTQPQFIQDCCRLLQGENNQNNRAQCFQTFKPYRGTELKENIPFSNINFEEKKNQSRKYIRENLCTSKDQTIGLSKYEKLQQSNLRNDANFVPLFPETIQTHTENLAPRRSPYLQMSSLPADNQKSMGTETKNGFEQRSDIGNIIDNLNSKLSNYIQTNNLQDTYRKFKLEFVQLRRNMPY